MAKVNIVAKKKAPAEETTKPGKGEVVKAKSNLPAGMMGALTEHAGKGVSKDADDNLIPIVAITQDLTPAARKKDPKYIEGCEPGMIWLKNAPEDIQFVPGEDGIIVQSCHFDKDIVEWIPRKAGGGMVARHRTMPVDAVRTPMPDDPNKFKWIRKNGNEMVDTRYHVVRIHLDDGRRLAYVIPFTSSGHTVSKGWMTTINNSLLDNGETAPSWAKLYKLTLKTKTNTQGTWFLFDVEDIGWIEDMADHEAGLALHNAFNKGEKAMDTSTFGQDDRDAAGEGRNNSDTM